MEKTLNKYVKALEGISYFEWMRLKQEVDMLFESKKNELLSKAKLALDVPTQKQSECEQD